MSNYWVSFWTIYKYQVNKTTSLATTGNLFVLAEAQLLAKIQAAAIVENKSSILHYYETSKYRRKAISIQVTSGRRFYVVGLIDEGVQMKDSLIQWENGKKLLKITDVKKMEQSTKMLLNPYRKP